VPPISSGDTAWVLAASALVLLMTPGLALFYGGMVRSKSVLNMLMMGFATIGVVSLVWVAYGYSLAFGTDHFNGLIGSFEALGLRGTFDAATAPENGIPVLAFVAFQLMFAIITPALISGAIADRARFGAWLVFVLIWASVVYVPVAHWVFAFGTTASHDGGWIADHLNAFDFAGGTAVHVNAGAAGLALALVLGKRLGWPGRGEGGVKFKPHNLPMVLLGAGLLWFGWFGFNAGSAIAANGTAAVAFVNTQVATGAALLGWIFVEWLRDGKPTTLGAASGAVAGLVAITPACAVLEPIGAIALGLIAGAVCALAVGLKYRFGFDDSLDVVGVHLVGGATGALLIGLLCTALVPGSGGVNGLFYGGGLSQLGKQAIAVAAVGGYSFVMSWLIGFAIDKTIGFRVKPEAEVEGVDTAEHAESAYEFGTSGSSGVSGAFSMAGIGSGPGQPYAGTHSASGNAGPPHGAAAEGEAEPSKAAPAEATETVAG
jgi:ammonium transporter, Amt family